MKNRRGVGVPIVNVPFTLRVISIKSQRVTRSYPWEDKNTFPDKQKKYPSPYYNLSKKKKKRSFRKDDFQVPLSNAKGMSNNKSPSREKVVSNLWGK